MNIERFEDLEIWQSARLLSKLIWQFTKSDEFNRDFRFRDQIRSSSGSVMDNIAEGFGRGGNKEFINFLLIAKGSNEETRSQLYRAFDYEYISKSNFDEAHELADKIARKINSLITYLKSSEIKGNRYKASEDSQNIYIPLNQSEE